MFQIHTDDDGNYNYNHFLTLYDPNRQPHELSGVATVAAQAENIFNQSLTQSQSVPTMNSKSLQRSESAEEQAAANNDRAVANELKKKWHNALRMCKAQDNDKSGFIKRDVFISSLEHHLGSVCMSHSPIFHSFIVDLLR